MHSLTSHAAHCCYAPFRPDPVALHHAALPSCSPRCVPMRPRRSRISAEEAGGSSSPAPPITTPSLPVLWTSAASRRMNLDTAVEDALESALAAAGTQHGTPAPDLALIFVSSAFADEYTSVVELLRLRVPSVKKVFGSSGYGVIGGSQAEAQEVESVPAISITLAHLPDAAVHLTHVAQHNLPSDDAPPEAWCTLLGLPPACPAPLSLVILADGSFLRLHELLSGLDYAFPHAAKIGGLASAGLVAPGRALWCFDADVQNADPATRHGVHHTGAVVLALSGGVSMELLVAQGVRALSPRTWEVTSVDRARNLVTAVRETTPSPSSSPSISSLAASPATSSRRGGPAAPKDIPPLEALQRDLVGQVGSELGLRSLLSNLMVGLAPDTLKAQAQLEAQDFLARPLGFEPRQGHMEIGDHVRLGQRLRFMVRDQRGAMEDLTNHGTAFKRRQLEAVLQGSPRPQPLGMLIFSCCGRGTSLYHTPSYDTKTVSSFVPVPAAGFLCNGEIGSVGGTTHLHGFTCCVGVLMPAEPVGPTAPDAGVGAAVPSPSSAAPDSLDCT